MECWSSGSKPNTPVLLYSNTPIGLIAPETFCSLRRLFQLTKARGEGER